MARLGSSCCCRPLLQGGMMLLALLLLASIQAGPVMAWEQAAEELLEKFRDMVVKKAPEQALTELSKRPGWGRFSKGGKTGLKAHRYLCKAQGWMDKQNPGGASGTPNFAVDILGGDLLPKSFPTFYYSVTSLSGGNSVVTCWSAEQVQVPATGTTQFPFPSRYQQQVPVQTPARPAYLSTAQP